MKTFAENVKDFEDFEHDRECKLIVRQDEGPYISGSSLRSASTSLDGVASTWSVTIDASALLPGGQEQKHLPKQSKAEANGLNG